MKTVALIGSPDRREAFLLSTGSVPDYLGDAPPDNDHLRAFELIFDLNLDEFPERLTSYLGLGSATVIGCAVKRSLLQMVTLSGVFPACNLLGINALPGFLERKVWEISSFHAGATAALTDYLATVGLETVEVRDQVGMATPRVLFSIINESFLMVQQGIVQESDLDLAMQLGVNYPQGPIAWGRAIGLQHVVAVLDALLALTADPRYRVADQLRKAACSDDQAGFQHL